MLKIKEAAPSQDEHEFSLNTITQGQDSTTFVLSSPTYVGLNIAFNLESAPYTLPQGYTVSVHLFKNTFHLQQEMIDLRVGGLAANSGKIGYFFRLDALFEKGTLQFTKHTYCYAYFGLQFLFSNQLTWQTKETTIRSEPYEILDFFDGDTIILVLCNEYCSAIPSFNIDNYLANLFLYGFVSFSKDNPIETVNKLPYLEAKYNSIKTIMRPDGVYVLGLKPVNAMLSGETFISHLFKNLIQRENDPVARFLMLYQVVEIYMSKVFPFEISNKICAQLHTLNSHKLKDMLDEMKKQKSLIQSLFNVYARPSNALEVEVKACILGFFTHVNHPDYNDPAKNVEFTLTDLFYEIRNKLVHEYRLLHAHGIDQKESILRLKYINWLTEALMAEVVTVFIT